MSATQPESPAAKSAAKPGQGVRGRKGLKRPSVRSELSARNWLTRLKREARRGMGSLIASALLHAHC